MGGARTELADRDSMRRILETWGNSNVELQRRIPILCDTRVECSILYRIMYSTVQMVFCTLWCTVQNCTVTYILVLCSTTRYFIYELAKLSFNGTKSEKCLEQFLHQKINVLKRK